MNSIDFELYKIFYTVAKNENISKSTKDLFISQPAITQRINNLEKQLNIKLFHRENNGIKLTYEGKILYSYIKSSIENMNQVEKKFNNFLEQQNGNVIRIKSATTENNFMICNNIIPYLEENANISVKMLIGDEKDAVQDLINGDIDIIAVNNKPNIKNKKLEIIDEKVLDICFYTTQEYIKKQGSKIDLLNSKNMYNFIIQKQNCFEKEEFNKFCEKNKVKIASIYEIDSMEIRNYFVKSGLGISIGFKQYIEKELNEKIFVEIPVDYKFNKNTIDFIIRKDSEKAIKFKKILKIS